MTATATKPQRALLVIDVQRAYTTGSLPIAYPPVAQSIHHIGVAMDVAAAHHIPIVVVQHSGFGEGSHDWELHEVVTSRHWDHHIDKALPSAFAGTDLAQWIEAHGIDTLTIVGYMTQNCNASTIYEARHRTLHVEYLSDATGAVAYANKAGAATAEEVHRVMGVIFESNFAAVLTTAEWAEAVSAGRATTRGSIMASVAQARRT